MTTEGDFDEDDEPASDILAAFHTGPPGLTAPPGVTCSACHDYGWVCEGHGIHPAVGPDACLAGPGKLCTCPTGGGTATTSGGVPLTEQLIAYLAEEAEAGYDLDVPLTPRTPRENP